MLDAGDAISGGKLVIDVAYFGWHIHSETHDLCEETSCPVSDGEFIVSHSQVLPGFTPPVSQSSYKMFIYEIIMSTETAETLKFITLFWTEPINGHNLILEFH